ncbi:putative DNA polymerase kappa isoform X5 [Penaeus vannamei]|uniref:DNA polymerase kappa n=1 Tax=Penaeus vannamei TaxID=6689 RepID=A0A423T4F0_PENVA|nr:putative DNA polymerase kappa isoform X5 [Penaeus vannamei]
MSKTDSDKENVDSAKMAEQTTKANRNDLPGSSSGPQNLALNTHKAGMEGLDTEKINEIIKKASEGSRFYQHKQKCQQRLDAKIMDHLVKELESRRDLTHTIVHVDMDMFYAAVEMRDDPSLRDKPMAVGSTGMLSTSNYAARKFGVRAAMPGFIGKKLCPDLVIVRPDFTKYKQASKEIQEIFSQYDPNFCPMSLDEAYLDITEYLVKNAHVLEMEDDGIASNTRLAKVCSDMNKPNGQYYLPPEHQRILDFISSLPIRKVSGIGNVMEQQLSAIGVNICSDLMKKRGLLKLLFSDINYNNFLSIALGLGHTTLSTWTEKDRKSISTETTFRGTADRNVLFTITKDLCHELADEMAQKDIFGKVFTLKYKTVDFQIRSRAHTFPDAVQTSEVMATTARRILQHEMDVSPQPLALRLIGVRMSNLLSSSEVGPNRQSTLTQLFSNNNASCATKHCSDDKKSTHLQKNNGESQLSAQSSISENANKKSMANQDSSCILTSNKVGRILNDLCWPVTEKGKLGVHSRPRPLGLLVVGVVTGGGTCWRRI